MTDSPDRDVIIRTAARSHLIDFAAVVDQGYQVSWHHQLVADALQNAYEQVLRGDRARIILELPPRHGKSDLATVKYPAWVLGLSPDLNVIVVSYSADLAADFGLKTRDTMNHERYQALFDTRLREDATARAKWMTTEGGSYTAVGVGGSMTGKGFTIGIIDDPIKNREEADSLVVREGLWKWYRSTFLTREDGNGAIICIGTRWHYDDLIGRILQSEGSEQWKVIKLPAIAEQDEKRRKRGEALWPERYPLEALETRRKDLGPYEWSSLYQQYPVDEASREFKKEWLQTCTLDELRRKNVRVFVTVDTASALRDKSDYLGVVVNLVDREGFWHLMAWQLKVSPKDLMDFLFKIREEYNAERFGIEQGIYQDVLKPFFEEEMRKRGVFLNVVELKHHQLNKHVRIRGLIPRYSSHSVFHVEGMCEELEEQLSQFPKGLHDDVLDALAYQNQIAEAPSPKRSMAMASVPIKPYYGTAEVPW